jgi:hypothetical protein
MVFPKIKRIVLDQMDDWVNGIKMAKRKRKAA